MRSGNVHCLCTNYTLDTGQALRTTATSAPRGTRTHPPEAPPLPPPAALPAAAETPSSVRRRCAAGAEDPFSAPAPCVKHIKETSP